MSPAQAFAQWLGAQHPDLFEALYAAHAQRHLSGLGDDGATVDFSAPDPQLQDVPVDVSVPDTSLADTISSPNIVTGDAVDTSGGSGFTGALENIGSWLTTGGGANAMLNLGTQIVKSQAQVAVIQAQAARARSGLGPIPITYAHNAQGQVVPVYDASTAAEIPYALEQAINSGQAQRIVLPDGSVGYSLSNPSLLSSVLGTHISPLWLVLGGAILLAALL